MNHSGASALRQTSMALPCPPTMEHVRSGCAREPHAAHSFIEQELQTPVRLPSAMRTIIEQPGRGHQRRAGSTAT